MTSRSLVAATINHKETLRVPYCIDLTFEGEQELKKAIGSQRPSSFLNNDVFQIGPPWWTWFNLGPDWQAFDSPVSPSTVVGTGDYQRFVDSVRMMSDHGGKYILAIIYGSHFEKAYFARGLENFLADLAADPPFARKLLNRIIEKNLVMLENIVALPEIDGVLLGSDWGTQRDLIMSPQTWEDLIRPGEQKEYDLVHAYGKHVWVHSCGKIDKIIPSLVEMGLDVLNPVQPEAMDLAELKSRFGAKLSFWGGISTQQTLPNGTPDEVRQEARRVRDLMSKGGGYIFGPSQSIQGDVPANNIVALIETAKESR